MFEDKFVKSNYSLEDLEEFRDEKGFIDLSKANIKFTDESKEAMGNQNRIKNWVKFKNDKVLIKGETILDEEKNYGIYAELIVEEIANQLGVQTAHYDLVKMIDSNGKETYGVLSVSIADPEKGQELVTLHDIIGDEKESEFADATSYDFTIEKLKEKLSLDGYEEKQINKVLEQYKKRIAFTIAVLDTDRHTENFAFIKTKEDGKDKISLSPIFDSEASLMLDNDISTIEMLLEDYIGLKQSVDVTQPKIGLVKSKEDGGLDSFWKDTLEEITQDDEVYDYCSEVLSGSIDMDIVLENVEKKIKAPLPETVQMIAKYSYNCRNEEFTNVLEGNIILEEDEGLEDINSILNFLINTGIEDKKITTSEQLEVGKQMQEDMKNKHVENLMEDMFFDRQ